MAGQTWKLLTCSDLHLGECLSGVSEVPDHLRDLFLDARYLAAERVFQYALEESVDMLLLAGHVLSIKTCDARSLQQLTGAFQRLGEAGIQVYWCDTPEDHLNHWPSSLALPPNVHLIHGSQPQPHLVRRGERVLGTLIGLPRSGDRSIPPHQVVGDAGRVTIGVTHDPLLGPDVRSPSIDLWIVGGPHQPDTYDGGPRRILSPGSPQGGCPQEIGPHGCVLVEVDREGRMESRFLPTDVLRWVREEVSLPDDFDQPQLLRTLRDRAARWLGQAGGQQLLVEWVLLDGDTASDTASDLLATRIRHGGADAEILRVLRAEFGGQVPGLWSLGLRAQPPEKLPSLWHEEDTVLGDLLRAIQQYRDDPQLPFRWETWHLPFTTGANHSAATGASMVDRPGELTRASSKKSANRDKTSELVQSLLRDVRVTDREQLLRSVAVLGVDLLRGERVLTED